ncbi:hypothetical protein [Salipiger abyssi]|uniref:hypothetical protein n=1 Tax=Salipiger abyssi TaxID=1250539 RepID=UPI001A8EF261|nr:hypothetical protein [Salipiger abyssi]MBN9885894.1 hypothetical protein [Salipiger abyssi]
MFRYSPSERAAIVAMAASITRNLDRDHMRSGFEPALPVDRHRRYIWHRHCHEHKRAFLVLWQLGVARRDTPELKFFGMTVKTERKRHNKLGPRDRTIYDKNLFPRNIMLMSRQEIETHLLDSDIIALTTVEEVLSAYIGELTAFPNDDYEHLPTPEGEEFRVTDSLHVETLLALAELGFLRSHVGHFQWTEKARPIIEEDFI